jgi:ABC-2 type transport system permease protein
VIPALDATVMRLEWRNLWAERTPLAAALLLGLAICYGAYNGAAWVSFQRTTIATALEEEKQRLAETRANIGLAEAGTKKFSSFSDPRTPGAVGRAAGTRYAVMPPGSLAPLAIGQSDLYPYYFRVSTQSKQTFLNNDEIENPVHLLAGRFDLAFVVVYLLPLVILAFTYNLVSAEKEAGTLAMTLSQPVALRRVVWAKVAVRAAFLLGMVIAMAGVAVVVGGARMNEADAWARLALWAAITLAYGAFWFVLAIAVNAWGRGSATNAIALFGLWLLLVVFVPSVLSVAVQTLYPVPSRVEMIQAMRVAGDEASRQGSQLLARYLEDHPELAPSDPAQAKGAPDFATLNVAVNETVEKKVQPVLELFDRQVASQQTFVDRLRFLSPAVVAQAAFNDLAGASAHRYRHFLGQADAFHRVWREYFIPRTLRKEKLTAEQVGQLPAFRFAEEPMAEVAGRLTANLAGLGVVIALVMWPVAGWLRRYPIA